MKKTDPDLYHRMNRVREEKRKSEAEHPDLTETYQRSNAYLTHKEQVQLKEARLKALKSEAVIEAKVERNNARGTEDGEAKTKDFIRILKEAMIQVDPDVDKILDKIQ